MARRHPPERGHVSLNHLLREAAELLSFELRVATIEVIYDLQRDLPLVWADGHQLKQVIVNLVTNARQVVQDSAPPRRLRLATRYDERRSSVRIEVADSGPGLPAEIRARVFDPFFTTKPDGEAPASDWRWRAASWKATGARSRSNRRPARRAVRDQPAARRASRGYRRGPRASSRGIPGRQEHSGSTTSPRSPRSWPRRCRATATRSTWPRTAPSRSGCSARATTT